MGANGNLGLKGEILHLMDEVKESHLHREGQTMKLGLESRCHQGVYVCFGGVGGEASEWDGRGLVGNL